VGHEKHNGFMNSPEKPSRPVLLIEDDENDVLIFRRSLAKIHSDLPLLVIPDGQAAWQYLSGSGSTPRPSRPSLILLDLKLPKMSGLEILASLKSDPDLRSIPVVIMTSSRAQADVDAVYARGADFYLVKALDAELAMEQAIGIHAYWTALREHPDDPGADPTLFRLRRLAELASLPY
jgi:CheY-like chemotaxis protein